MKRIFSLLITSAFCLFLGACASIEQKTTAHNFAGSFKSHASQPSIKKSTSSHSLKSKSWDSSKHRTARTTAYSHMENEPGAYGRKNAIGTNLRYGNAIRSAAADWSRFPLGTQFRIKGKPHIYEIDDYGSALCGTNTIDIYKPTLSMMNAWGVRHVDIEIIKWGCFDKSSSILSKRTGYWHCRKMYEDMQPQVGRQSTNPTRHYIFKNRTPSIGRE